MSDKRPVVYDGTQMFQNELHLLVEVTVLVLEDDSIAIVEKDLLIDEFESGHLTEDLLVLRVHLVYACN